MVLSLLIYVAAGAVVGFVSGLFGIGGGVIVVPMLLPIFQAQGLSMDVAMHMAVGSSLATIVITGLSSARAHWRLGNLVVSALPWLVAGLVTGALIGAQLAAALSGDILRIIFALFVLALAARMAFALEPPPGRIMPRPAAVAAVGGVIGTLSSLVGIGGGTLVVPFLVWSG
ncbi:sulfite exporter TauE/SafE family protein, partial [Spiribacter sp. SSL99]